MPIEKTEHAVTAAQTLAIDQVAPELIGVNRFHGTEALSHLFRFEISLTVSALGDPFIGNQVAGRSASFSFDTQTGRRFFHGVIGRFASAGHARHEHHYTAELYPALWLLTHRYASRIFQEKSVPEIIEHVVTKSGLSLERFVMVLTEKHPQRDYCVQYRETDFHFISRLMEEEGVYYFFEHDSEQSRVVFADSAVACVPIGSSFRLPYVPPGNLNATHSHVYEFDLDHEVRPGSVVLRDYNFENPNLDLHCIGRAERDAALEVSDYPGEYTEQAVGANLARLRMEELECRRHRARGATNCGEFSAGRVFELDGHPVDGFDGSYLLTKVVHRGRRESARDAATGDDLPHVDARVRQFLARASRHTDEVVRELATMLARTLSVADSSGDVGRGLPRWVLHSGQIARNLSGALSAMGEDPLDSASFGRIIRRALSDNGDGQPTATYECEFECAHAAVPFRPSRVTPWPVMRGCQTATVVGPPGEEIHTDRHGRVKVQFYWDREGRHDEDSSCWIRVSQPWAGVRYGGMAIPRIGQEVIVDFLEGDPDRPIITGRVYNADTMPPQDLPKDKVRTTIRSNTHKGKGFNEITMDDTTGQEHFYMKSQYDKTEEVGNNRSTSVGVDSTEVVGNNKTESVGNNQSTDVTNAYNVNCDTFLLNAKTSITLQCGASRIHMNQAGFISITGTVITSAATVNNSMVAPMTEVVGAVMLSQAGAVVVIEGGATHVRGEVLAAVKGAEVNVIANGDNVIQGGQVKIN